MPKRSDINSILIVGAGPIVIGQGCEFDYSGTQACNALREEGYKVILINSNPATIMTDPDIADLTFIEPITPENIEKIIQLEKPDAILPTMGGQTALNASLKLEKSGILKKHNVEMIGAKLISIEMAEDRVKFKQAMTEIGLDTAKSKIIAHHIEQYNNQLGKDNPYLLIGPGRWGSSDPWLGIPVSWNQINHAKIIIELGIEGLEPDPSFGSHFFQNLTSLHLAYFTLNKKQTKTKLNWDLLNGFKIQDSTDYVKLIKLDKKIDCIIDGTSGKGIIKYNQD